MHFVEQIGVSVNKTFWFSSTVCKPTNVNSAIIITSLSEIKRANHISSLP
jgi:hypothetical protein